MQIHSLFFFLLVPVSIAAGCAQPGDDATPPATTTSTSAPPAQPAEPASATPPPPSSDQGVTARARATAQHAKELLGKLLAPASQAFSLLREDKANKGTIKGGIVKAMRWTTVEDLLDAMVAELGSEGEDAHC